MKPLMGKWETPEARLGISTARNKCVGEAAVQAEPLRLIKCGEDSICFFVGVGLKKTKNKTKGGLSHAWKNKNKNEIPLV